MKTIAAIVNCRGTSSFVSSGFPLCPGDCTESNLLAREVVLKIGGIEVPSHISALRGRHPDGSIRSLLIQFTLPAPVTMQEAEVIIGGDQKTTLDPAYVYPTYAVVSDGNVIVPADADYLCASRVTFQELLPFGGATAAEEKQYTALAEDRFVSLKASGNRGTATYETGRALAALWQRSGELSYYYETLDYIFRDMCPYNFPGAGVTHASAIYTNPENLSYPNHTNFYGWESGSEPEFPRSWTYAAAYLMTGYPPFWAAVCAFAQSVMYTSSGPMTTQEIANRHILPSGNYPRYAYRTYSPTLPAALLDATLPIKIGSLPAMELDYSDILQWSLNAILLHAWDVVWIPCTGWNRVIPNIGSIDGFEITQGDVTATALGIYFTDTNATYRVDQRLTQSATAPSSPASNSFWHNTTDNTYWMWNGSSWVDKGVFGTDIYLQVKLSSISGGEFTTGALASGLTATISGAAQVDARNGMLGIRSNGFTRETTVPLFQLIFPANFLIDYYNNFYADSRIPDALEDHLRVVLQYILALDESDNHYGGTSATWGTLTHANSYGMSFPIVDLATKTPWILPEFCRLIAFTKKMQGDLTIEGNTLSQWYDICINTANNSPALTTGGLIWQWKLFGQYYGMSQDCAWIYAQESLSGPSSVRELVVYSDIPRFAETYAAGEEPEESEEPIPLPTAQFNAGYFRGLAQFVSGEDLQPMILSLDFPDTAPCSLLGYQVWSKLGVTDEEITALWSE